MDIDNKRTALDVLLSLEQQIINLNKLISSVEHTNKIILNRLANNSQNSTLSIPSINSIIKTPEPISAVKVIEPSKFSDEVVRQKQRQSPSSPIVKSSQENEVNFPSADEEKPVNKNVSKIPVIQRIVNQEGKHIYMANVSVRDMNTNAELYSGQTTPTGKWTANFPVGTYIIKVIKTDKQTKQPVESKLQFEVKPDMKALQLPNFVVDVNI